MYFCGNTNQDYGVVCNLSLVQDVANESVKIPQGLLKYPMEIACVIFQNLIQDGIRNYESDF